MDGLSAGAGVIGVISLAMQLSEAAYAVVRFLNTITDAPREVMRLKELINLLYVTSVGVKSALEFQQQLHGDNIQGSENIHDALTVCQQRLGLVQDILDKTESIERGQTLVSRNWARFRLAARKDDIGKLERQLGQGLDVLNVLLTTNIMYSNVKNTLFVADKINGLKPSVYNPPQCAVQTSHKELSPRCILQKDEPPLIARDGSKSEKYAVVSRTYQEQSQRTVTTAAISTFWGIDIRRIGKLNVSTRKKRTTRENEDGSWFESKSSSTRYFILPSFLSRCIEFTISHSAHSSPSCSLRVGHVVSSQDNAIVSLLLYDDVQSLQQMFSDGKCTLDTSFDIGLTLFEVAEFWGSLNTASFLIDQGCNVELRCAVYALTPGMNVREELRRTLVEHIYSKLDLTECNPYELLPIGGLWEWGHTSPLALHAIETLLVLGLRQTILPNAGYLGSLLNILCQGWLQPESVQKDRDGLAKRLILNGADIHHADRYGRTPLRHIARTSSAMDCTVEILHWLELLRCCDIDVPQYLHDECDVNGDKIGLHVHDEPDTYCQEWRYHCIRPRKIGVSLQSPGKLSVTLKTHVDLQSTAELLLQEFGFYSDLTVTFGTHCGQITSRLEVYLKDLKNSPYHEGRKTIGECLVEWRQSRIKLQEQSVDGSLSDGNEPRRRDWPELGEYLNSNDIGYLERIGIFAKPYLQLCRCDAYGNYIDLWPFCLQTHTLCNSGSRLGGGCLRPFELNINVIGGWCRAHSCRFNHARFARKQAKKMAKQMRAQGISSPKNIMPGTWIK